jgi:hypothetical protein
MQTLLLVHGGWSHVLAYIYAVLHSLCVLDTRLT